MERKLTAILSADVKGYSRLMGDDEAATVRTLTAYREVMAEFIRKYRGRVVDFTGDNALAEFTSVVDAVQCAVEIQRELRTRNAELPDHRRMEFRIGINLGDVIADGERIYGDGVNIAARLEGLAEAGGICLSGTTYDQVENKLALDYEYVGEHTVKNIEKPVRVYRVRPQLGTRAAGARAGKRFGRRRWPAALAIVGVLLLLGAGVAIWNLYLRSSPPPAEVASTRAPALQLPEKPSIAVLPFTNMSADPQQEYFSDGITEDLITDLSKLSGLFVIARNSTFTYKGNPVNVKQVGQDLGVRYVLEGSVRKAGRRMRITAQLVDASTGHHLWAERYDRDVKDVFALQDEITQKIVVALAVQLTEGEKARRGRSPTASLEAYDHFLRGTEYLWRSTKESNARARQMFERAIDLDPQYADAHAWLGVTHWIDWAFQWRQDPQALAQAFKLAQRAVRLDESLPNAHKILAHIYLWQKDHDQAIAEAERVIALDPNYADGYTALGEILTFAGRPAEALGLLEKAMRLDPRYPFWYLWTLGHAYRLLGRYDDAIATQKRALTRNPDYLPSHAELVVLYSELGRDQEARASTAECRRLSPQATLESLRKSLPYKDPAVLERYIEAFRKTGLK